MSGPEDFTLHCQVLGWRDAGVAFEVPDEVRLIIPAELDRAVEPRGFGIDIELQQKASDPQEAGEHPRCQPHDSGEFSVKIAVGYPKLCGDLGDRTRRVAAYSGYGPLDPTETGNRRSPGAFQMGANDPQS